MVKLVQKCVIAHSTNTTFKKTKRRNVYRISILSLTNRYDNLLNFKHCGSIKILEIKNWTFSLVFSMRTLVTDF